MYYKNFINDSIFYFKGDFLVEISVIVPVYNVSEYLAQCMDSIINQTFEDIEIICVNDGSTDDSLKILEEYREKDERIIIISQENQGQGVARNVGMKVARGNYIFFMDSDDFIKLNALELLHENAVSNNSDVVFYRFYKYVDGEEIPSPMFNFEEEFPNADFNDFTFTYNDAKGFVLNNAFSPWSKLYSRRFFDANPDFHFPEQIAFEDVPPHVMLMIRASRISFVPEFLYCYRYNEASSVNNPESAFDILKIVEMVIDFIERSNLEEEFRLDLDYFKFKRVNFHLSKTYSEEFFQKSKELCESIVHTDLLRDFELERYEFILHSDSFAEYLHKIYTVDKAKLENRNRKLKKDLKKVKSSNRKLKKDLLKAKNNNEKLKKDLDDAKKVNDEIMKSNSWKITKPFRKGGKLFK